jgi:hypothetical protein
MAKTVAEMLIDRLIAWRVNTIFGFPGDGVNGIFEALRTNQKKIEFNRLGMKRRRHSLPSVTPSTPAV